MPGLFRVASHELGVKWRMFTLPYTVIEGIIQALAVAFLLAELR